MEIHLKIIGTLLILLALIHVIFPRYFHWKKELASLSLFNREMMYVHSFFIALTVLLMGILCITETAELIYTPLGKKILLGLGIFWGFRLIIQVAGYSSANWRGKTFETFVHLIFTLFWGYITIVFLKGWFN